MTDDPHAELRALLRQARHAALATVHEGSPAVSMVPFAMLPAGRGFVIHVSSLASHTQDMLQHPAVALLVTATDAGTENVLALPRVSINGRAEPCPADSADYPEARACYLARLPEAEALFSFADFSLFIIRPESVRHVAGFGRASTLRAAQLPAALQGAD